MYPALANELLKLAYEAHNFLLDEAKGGIVRTISRTQAVWGNFKKYKYTLSDTFIKSLISKEETRTVEAAAKREHKFNAKLEAGVEIVKLGAAYWMKFYNDMTKANILSYGDLDFIKSIASVVAKYNIPTPRQCDRLVKIVNLAEDKGYVMP